MGRVARYLTALFIVAMVVLAILAVASGPVPEHPFFAGDDLLVIAHQGGEKLRPDNTMMAFQYAAELGADVLEMDVHSTRDGVLVVMHDERVDRTTNGSGFIREMLITQIQGLDAAYHWPHDNPIGERPYRGQGVGVPELREVFEAFPEMRLNIEIKQAEPSIVQPLCNMIREFGRSDDILVGSFHDDAIRDFREACPEVATSGTEPEIRAFFVLNAIGLGKVFQPTAPAFQVPEYSGMLHVVTEHFLAGAHRHNIDVHVWTVDDPADMQRLIDLGVDGIITNRPDLLLELLGRRPAEMPEP